MAARNMVEVKDAHRLLACPHARRQRQAAEQRRGKSQHAANHRCSVESNAWMMLTLNETIQYAADDACRSERGTSLRLGMLHPVVDKDEHTPCLLGFTNWWIWRLCCASHDASPLLSSRTR